MLAIGTPGGDDQTERRPAIVIMYIWTAPGVDTAGFHRATGVSDDQYRAQEAAEAALRTGHGGTAYVERVYTAEAAPALSLCYVRTGTGWQARLGQAGHVEWTALTAPGEVTPMETAGSARALTGTAVSNAASTGDRRRHGRRTTWTHRLALRRANG